MNKLGRKPYFVLKMVKLLENEKFNKDLCFIKTLPWEVYINRKISFTTNLIR